MSHAKLRRKIASRKHEIAQAFNKMISRNETKCTIRQEWKKLRKTKSIYFNITFFKL